MMFTKINLPAILLVMVVLCLGIAGCSDDDNPVDSNNESDHFHAVGSKLVLNGTDIILADTADSTDVIGLVELIEGEELVFEAWFLDDEGEWFYPGDNTEAHSDHQLEVVAGNGDLISAETNDWEVHLTGMEEGASWIRLKVKHIDHYGYISPHLRTSIHHGEGYHGEPVAMFLVSSIDTLVRVDSSNEITGEISVSTGNVTGEIEIFLMDENDRVFQPEDDHSLGILVENETIASITPDSTWTFHANGISMGQTTVIFSILHGDHTHYTSPSISLRVQ